MSQHSVSTTLKPDPEKLSFGVAFPATRRGEGQAESEFDTQASSVIEELIDTAKRHSGKVVLAFYEDDKRGKTLTAVLSGTDHDVSAHVEWEKP